MSAATAETERPPPSTDFLVREVPEDCLWRLHGYEWRVISPKGTPIGHFVEMAQAITFAANERRETERLARLRAELGLG